MSALDMTTDAPTDTFIDELSDEALDRADTSAGRNCLLSFSALPCN